LFMHFDESLAYLFKVLWSLNQRSFLWSRLISLVFVRVFEEVEMLRQAIVWLERCSFSILRVVLIADARWTWGLALGYTIFWLSVLRLRMLII
jgi:hypothetical protein